MDPLRARIAGATAGRPWLPAALAVLAAAVLGAAVLVAAGSAAGSTTEPAPVAVRTAPVASPTPSSLLVHVGGAVRRPGLVALPDGARVVDALAAAGGPGEKADTEGVNLAARVVDGQQILVPRRGAPATSSTAAATAVPGASAPVGLSSATAEQLETLPRIGPALAARIVAYRDAHGGFRTVDELGQVGGIGPKTLAGLRALVTP